MSTGDRCLLTHLRLGYKDQPADSCKQIYDSNLDHQKKSSAKSGVYWIKTSLKGSEAVQTFCDMASGGWTLVGKVSGQVGNIHTKWLIQNQNSEQLKSPIMNRGKTGYSCLDARVLAVKHASKVMLSSADIPGGVGSKWVLWKLPPGRKINTWWNHRVGQARVRAAGMRKVTVKAWNGGTKVEKHNLGNMFPKIDIMSSRRNLTVMLDNTKYHQLRYLTAKIPFINRMQTR